MKKYILSILFSLLVSSLSIVGQDNVARLTVLIGSHIEFNFNSLQRYENGIQIPDGTTFGITMVDLTAGTLTGWHIDAQTYLGAVDLVGAAGNTLPSETIQIEATDANGNLGGATFFGLQDLSPVGATLMETNDPAHIPANPNTPQVNISYECGMLPTNNLMGAPSDYYFIEVEFILIPDF